MVRDAAALGELRELYEAKASAEEDAADALLPAIPVARDGDPLARLLLVKGAPGEAELAVGAAIAGPDGEAARSALAALGIALGSVLAVVSRPSGAATPVEPARERLARYLEAADPALAVALDAEAAEDLAAAAGSPRPLRFGEPVRVRGRVLLAVDGLEASLADEARKKRVWGQFKSLKDATGAPSGRP